MLKRLLLLIAAALAAPALAQSVPLVDTNNPPPPLAQEFGPQTWVSDGITDLSPYLQTGYSHVTGEAPSLGDGNLGTFRFDCSAGQVLADDPVVYPGQHGKSHGHQFYGNLLTDFSSTYTSQRTTGLTTCGNILNRSGYWMPALLQGTAVIRPDSIKVYYKRPPKTGPECTPGNPLFAGRCVGTPNAIRYIFGVDMLTGTIPTGSYEWSCINNSADNNGLFLTIAAALNSCSGLAAGRHQLFMTIDSPSCWDGIHLDSANHRSHMSNVIADPSVPGRFACPAATPYLIPIFHLGVSWDISAGGVTLQPSASSSDWCTTAAHLSSDCMPGMTAKEPGTTMHADYFEGWNQPAKKLWTDNCIDRYLHCFQGDLGDGTMLKQIAAAPGTANPRWVLRPKMAMEASGVMLKAPQ